MKHIIVMTIKREMIKKSYCSPLTPSAGNYSNWYSIYNNKIYFLKENENTEVWEIHAHEI